MIYYKKVKNEHFGISIRYISIEEKKMKDKCTKYEALFTFSDEEYLKNHLKDCEECQKEQEKMDKVSKLLQEVKFELIKKRKSTAKAKFACAMLALLMGGTLLGIINFNQDVSDILHYGQTLSSEDYGFPVDSYGLIMVD